MTASAGAAVSVFVAAGTDASARTSEPSPGTDLLLSLVEGLPSFQGPVYRGQAGLGLTGLSGEGVEGWCQRLMTRAFQVDGKGSCDCSDGRSRMGSTPGRKRLGEDKGRSGGRQDRS